MKSIIIPVAAGLVAAGAGFFVGYKIGDVRGRKETWEIAGRELENVEDQIKRRYKVAEYAEPPAYFDEDGEKVLTLPDVDGLDPVQLQALQEHVNSGAYATIKEARVVEMSVNMEGNIFDNFRETHVDVEPTGNPNRNDPEPIIITELEYSIDEEDYDKLSVSWYPVDRVLVDSQEQPIDDVETTVGFNNLNYLGEERTTLYVRNHKLQADYEIAVELGSYRETVLGESDEDIMERPRPRKRRTPKDE